MTTVAMALLQSRAIPVSGRRHFLYESGAGLRPHAGHIRHTEITVIQERFNPKGSRALSPPRTLRNWLGTVAVFLGLLAQTLHTHPLPAADSAATKGHAVLSASVQGPDTCPLCAAMHSASPARAAGPAISLQTVPLSLPARQQRFIGKPPAYAHFSRPPPHSFR